MVVVGPYVCGQRGMALLVKVCEWMWLPCLFCHGVDLSLTVQLLVLLATNPVTSRGVAPLLLHLALPSLSLWASISLPFVRLQKVL